MLLSSRLELIRELETRTERVYHGVNGNPGVSTLGGRQRTDDSNEPLTMAQIGAIIAAGIGYHGQPGEYSFEEVEGSTYSLNDVPCERIFVALMLMQAELFQQKYERL